MASFLLWILCLCQVIPWSVGGYLQRDRESFVAKTNPFDRMVLDFLYNVTYDTYHEHANWTGWGNSSSTSDPCTDGWYGITCAYIEEESVYYVSGIDLPDHLLPVLPNELTEMKHLKLLVLSGNYFQSYLPSGIFAMQSLEYLDISMIEDLNMTLPTQLELPKLTHFIAFSSRLYGYLPSSWNTPNLESLILNDNQFTGQIPYDIGKLLSLKQLMLQNNQLFGNFPSNFGDLHQLTDLSLIQEGFSRFCPFFPSSWETMFSLVNVSLCAYGTIPDYIGNNWEQLRMLTMKHGGVYGGIPTSLCKLSRLQTLDLSYNKLDGSIPDCVFQMSSLLQLDLSSNLLSGQISESIGELQKLENLFLYSNHFNGTLPKSIGKLTTVKTIALNNNFLIGEVPSEFDLLRNSQHTIILYFDNNMLSTIGDGLEYFFQDISYVGLYGNPLQCPLPLYVQNAKCSMCNTGSNHNNCVECLSDDCGWCSYGPNCVEGTHQGPSSYSCPEDSWSFGTCRNL